MMSLRFLSPAAVAMTAFLLAANGSRAEDAADASLESEIERSLRASHEEWGKEWARREADKIMARYAPDAVLFVPGSTPAKGPEASAPFIREMLKKRNFALAWAVDRVKVSASGDVAYLYGRYVQHTPTADESSYTIETGHYVTALEVRNGRWLAVADIHTPGPLASREGLPPSAFAQPAR